MEILAGAMSVLSIVGGVSYFFIIPLLLSMVLSPGPNDYVSCPMLMAMNALPLVLPLVPEQRVVVMVAVGAAEILFLVRHAQQEEMRKATERLRMMNHAAQARLEFAHRLGISHEDARITSAYALLTQRGRDDCHSPTDLDALLARAETMREDRRKGPLFTLE